jgi:hypothetical protein
VGPVSRLGAGPGVARPGFVASAVVAVVVTVLLAALLPAQPVLAAEVTFDTPVVQATLGKPFRVSIGFRSTVQPTRVELLTRLPSEDSWFVREAEITGANGRYAAVVEDEDHVLPNTRFLYRFRVTAQGARTLTPEGTIAFTDERFRWQVLEGRLVRIHWYEGSREFAQRALSIGEKAVADVSGLLGVTESEPIDFFVYASESAFREALGPGTRENVGGQASASIRTLFALIEPSQINSDWVDVVIPHELNHLVFDTAVENPYRDPPHWLDEGIAVYLSEGYSAADRNRVSSAARSGELIPLDGLAGQFPATREKFFLAYAESVSAVDFFIRKHGRDTLIKLVRSYGQGLTDDEAFRAATGADVKAFNVAWLADVGARAPQAYGPRPGAPGPVPPGWTTRQPSSAGPGASPDPGATPGAPDPAPAEPGEERTPGLVLVGVALAAFACIVLGAMVIDQRRRRAGSVPAAGPPTVVPGTRPFDASAPERPVDPAGQGPPLDTRAQALTLEPPREETPLDPPAHGRPLEDPAQAPGPPAETHPSSAAPGDPPPTAPPPSSPSGADPSGAPPEERRPPV